MLDQKLGPVLSIRPNSHNSLHFQWNLGGISLPQTQLYHLFCFVGNRMEKAKTFAQGYCSKVKNGEIVGVYKPSKDSSKRGRISWEEKTGLNPEKQLFISNNLIAELTQQYLAQVSEKIGHKKGIILVNIFCDSEPEEEAQTFKCLKIIEKSIKKIRLNSNFDNLIFNFISESFDCTKVNLQIGVNLISFQSDNPLLSSLDALEIGREIILKSITIKIMIKNKNISSCNNNHWRMMENSQLQKKLYGLPKVQFVEEVLFANISSQIIYAELQIEILLSFFDNTQIKSKKQTVFQIAPKKKDTFSSLAFNDSYEILSLNLHEFNLCMSKKTTQIFVSSSNQSLSTFK